LKYYAVMLPFKGLVQCFYKRPVANETRAFILAEVRYTTGEQELLAVVHAFKVRRCYLEGPFLLSSLTTIHWFI
jgi:hypothetical protein